MHWRILLLTFLCTTPAHGLKAQTNDKKDEGSSYSHLAAELDPLNSERVAFDPMVQLHLNWTRPGKRRGPKMSLPRSQLEARQGTSQCNPTNYVLVCPITEHSPCCPPDFLVCCHDPSDTCCPVGTFCTGLQTCCVNGAIGCGESCCPSGLVCGTVNGAQTCVDPSASTVAASITGTASTTRGQGGGSETTTGGAGVGSGTSSSVSFADPAYTPSDQGGAKVDTAVIGGAVGGGVGALILIALLAWYLLRQKKPKTISEPAGPESVPTPYTNGRPPMAAAAVMHDSSPAYPDGHAQPVIQKSNHPWSQNSSGAVSGFPYGGSVTQGTSYGNSSNPPPAGSVGGMMAMSDAGSSGVVGLGGYVPPPPEDIPTTTSPGPGGGYYGGPTAYGSAAMSPTSAYSSSQHNATSAAGTTYGSNPPWVSGLGSPSIEQQEQHQQRYSQQQQNPPWASGISSTTHDQQPHSPPQPQQPQLQPQQALQVHRAPPPQPWLHPGFAASPSPMTPPPPPFSPGPFGAPPPEGSSGGGRVVPMNAPADRKAKPTTGASS